MPFGENRTVRGRETWGQNSKRRLLVKVSCVPVEEEERAESLRKQGQRGRGRALIEKFREKFKTQESEEREGKDQEDQERKNGVRIGRRELE